MKKTLIIVGLLLLLSSCVKSIEVTYTVFFESNGGSVINDITVAEGSTCLEPDQPIKSGYTFEGWYQDVDLTIPYLFSNQVNENLTIYAKWEANVYHLLFVDDDETVLLTEDYAYGTDLSTLNIPEVVCETGYSFIGWDVEIPATMPANDLTLHAQYEINSYEITFNDYDDSLISNMSYEYGSDLSTIITPQPTRTGYTFVAWDVDIPATMPANNLTLKAQYAINSYQITFNDYDGSLISNISYEYGSDLSTIIEPQLTRSGYTFTGWDIGIPNTMPATDLVLQATYTINSYQLIFMDTQEIVISSTSYDYGTDLTSLELPVPVKEGHTFIGWDNILPNTMPASNVVLRATYMTNRYTLTYMDDDETILYTNEFYFQASLSTVFVSDPTKFGYTFSSWDQILPTVMPANDLTLRAQYDVNQYMINFYDFDATLIESIAIDYNALISSVSLPEPTRIGYSFIGWHSPLPTRMPANALEYHAVYEINEYLIQFVDYNDSILYESMFPYQSSLAEVTISDPIRYGYSFDGWDDTLPLSMPANDITIYSQYVANIHVITFYDYNDTVLTESNYDYETDLTTITEPLPIRTGYTFVGWDQNIPATMPNEDISFIAVYQIITYDLNYVLYEGQNGSNPDVYTIMSEEIMLDNPSKTGYAFDGWYDNESYEGTPITSIASGSVGHVTLYAKWHVISYNITYILDDGSNAENPDVYMITSEDIILNNPTKTGYAFDGWYESESFEGTPTTSILSGSIGDVMLYAKWNINEYQLTYITFDAYDALTDIALSYDETMINAALGSAHTITLTSEGDIISWGFNLYGQLGDSVDIERSYLNDVTDQFNLQSGEQIVSVVAGENCTMVLTSLGHVFTFGENSDGQLGDGTTTYKNTPTDITSNFNLLSEEMIVAIYMGGDNAAAITSLNRVFTWGNNNEGQIGDGTYINRTVPVDITNQLSLMTDETVLDIAIANKHYVLYTSSDRVFSWGNNSSGQIGNGSITSQSTPLDITSQFNFSQGESVIAISVGYLHAALITSTGRLFMWGENMYGQLGDDTTIDKNVPTDITLQFMYELQFNEKINQVTLGESHSLIVTSLGRVYTWGRNNQGQLGDSTLLQRKTPIEITSFFNLESEEYIILVSSGKTHQFAVTNQNRVFTWGYNANGQLGDGTTTRSTVPVQLNFIGVYDETTTSVEYNASLTSYDTIRTGYTLDSWYIDEACTIAYASLNMPDEDLVLYGKWISSE